ncbi:oligoribonuclease [Rathayibacter toxicus]|uniref:oligoribonuclease n=1 Tax=Rathayibacter toxicus TaxID=145458 RepID=UPI001C055ABD|nr:oligoribonuclease [Rathayibacter toxicus]QWL32405.1 oligoribonuclease [Rathayibacter toxicus]QWL34499.1 oligoribonuclease [Rathayibacter toxicus]QWL36631.1 oligoribonuclease [Rathayibacter toxicus]QWL38720.1 oligoribonuclease [Rathayibacter toxicus]QWL40808.1 oligoribonuclease [Rathayibacter toxicus]
MSNATDRLATDRLVWIDCEMTGLDLAVDELVEIAVVVTNFELEPLDEGLSIVIRPDASALENMGEFVRSMHETSGLLAEIQSGVNVAEAEYQALEYVLAHVPAEQHAPLAGNSIGTDRAFLAKYMPRLDSHLHYRNVDVSTLKELSRRWFPRIYFNAPAKQGGHRALADILESIRELSYYRRALFVAQPGPSTAQAQAASAATMAEFTSQM